MPLNRLAPWFLIAVLACTSGCLLDRSPIDPFDCVGALADDAALHTDGAIPGWCLAQLDGAVADAMVLPDAGIDADLPDADLPDAGPPDGGTADGGSDAGMDGGSPDGGRPDAGPPDAGPGDSGPPDGGTDAGPPAGCADGTVDQPYPGRTDIVGCDGAVPQCMAETLCDAGWHLCSFSEYQARVGTVRTATTFRWLASCVRSGCGDLTADPPTDGVCGAAICSSGSTATLTLQYQCGSLAPTETVACNVGVVADTDPIGNHVGLPSTPCSRARIMPVGMGNGATCCR